MMRSMRQRFTPLRNEVIRRPTLILDRKLTVRGKDIDTKPISMSKPDLPLWIGLATAGVGLFAAWSYFGDSQEEIKIQKSKLDELVEKKNKGISGGSTTTPSLKEGPSKVQLEAVVPAVVAPLNATSANGREEKLRTVDGISLAEVEDAISAVEKAVEKETAAAAAVLLKRKKDAEAAEAAEAKLDLKKKAKVEKVSAIMKSNGIPSLPPVVAPVSREDLRNEMAAKAEKMHGESVERASNDLRQSFESKILTSISRDLATLTEDQLKARVVGLSNELRDHTTLEAVRLHETLRQQEEYLHKKTLDLLSKQALEYDSLLARELKVKEGSIKAHDKESEAALIKIEKARIESSTVEFVAAMNAFCEGTVLVELIKFNEENSGKIQEIEKELGGKMEAEKDVRGLILKQLHQGRDQAIQSAKQYYLSAQRSGVVHQIQRGIITLEEKVEGSSSFARELNFLRLSSLQDPFIQSMIGSLPSHVVNGVPSLSQLHDRFFKVAEVARVAALTPDSSGIMGHFLGRVTSFFLLRGTSEVDLILSNAEKDILSGDISGAIKHLETLKGEARDTCKDFIAAAKSRLLVEQSLSAIKGHVNLAVVSLQ